MTALRPRVRRSVALLDERSLTGLQQLLAADPFVNAVAEARVAAAGSLAPERLGGYALGAHEDGSLVGACLSGGNLLPIGGDPAGWRALADVVAAQPRTCSSIVGRTAAVEAMWERLEPVWGPPRAIRAAQPVLVLDHLPDVPADPEVGPAAPHQLDRYLPAAAAMFTDELGVSPHVAPGTAAFHARIRHLIAERRALARFDFRGQVIFKAEIAAVTAHTAQVQGVWVRPDLRRRGIGTAALAAVFEHALRLAPTVSLYVNDFNEPARRMYDRLGMREQAVLSTVILG